MNRSEPIPLTHLHKSQPSMRTVTKMAVLHFLLPGVNIFQWYIQTLCIYLCISKLTHLICISKSLNLGIIFWFPTDEDFVLFNRFIFQSFAPGLSTNLCTGTHILPCHTSSSHFVSIYIMLTLFWPCKYSYVEGGKEQAELTPSWKRGKLPLHFQWALDYVPSSHRDNIPNWPPRLINTRFHTKIFHRQKECNNPLCSQSPL